MEKPVHPCVGSDVFETARSKLFVGGAISADEAKNRLLNGSYTTRGSKAGIGDGYTLYTRIVPKFIKRSGWQDCARRAFIVDRISSIDQFYKRR